MVMRGMIEMSRTLGNTMSKVLSRTCYVQLIMVTSEHGDKRPAVRDEEKDETDRDGDSDGDGDKRRPAVQAE